MVAEMPAIANIPGSTNLLLLAKVVSPFHSDTMSVYTPVFSNTEFVFETHSCRGLFSSSVCPGFPHNVTQNL